MLTAAARSFLITTSLICSAALLSACGGGSSPDEDDRIPGSSSSESAQSSSAEPAQSSSSESAQSSSSESAESSSSEAPSSEPDAFSFEDQVDVEPGAEVTSNTIVIQGMDEPVAIEISGGYYAINSEEDDAFTDQPGEIEAGDELTLRTQAPANGSQVHKVTVIIGSVSGLWRVSTPEDTEAPRAAFAFPTPMTATDAETLTLRGTASDELSQIDAVRVTVTGESGAEVYTVDSDDGFATWTVEVSLAPGDNQIQLGAEDVLGNADDDIARITVRQQSFDLAFPDNESPFVGIQDMTFDHENGRLLVAERDPSHSPTGSVRSVDLITGKREKWASGEASEDLLEFSSVESIEMDYKRNRVLLGPTEGKLVAIDLESGERELLAGPDVPSSSEPTFRSPRGILIDPEDEDFAYVASASDRRLVRFNLNSGERKIISSDEVGEGDWFRAIRMVMVGPSNEFAYIAREQKIFKVDLKTGDREALDMEGYPHTRWDGIAIDDLVLKPGHNQFYIADGMEGILLYDIDVGSFDNLVQFSFDDHFGRSMFYYMSLDEKNQVMMLVERDTKAVVAVDLQTKEYVLISKSVDEDDD